MTQRGKHAPNTILRRLREERGWSLRRVADELCLLAEVEDENRIPGVNANMVGIWERGWKRPSPFYQTLFCQLYHCSASQLGFVSHDTVPPHTEEPQQAPIIPVPLPSLTRTHEQTRAIDLLCSANETTSEQQAGTWLTLGASGLGQLFNEGWTLEEVLTSLQMVLQSIQAMPVINRRQLQQLSGAAVMKSIPVPVGEQISEEERMRFTGAMGESIGAAWKLFHTARNAQILAIAQTQLCLLQETSAYLYPGIRPALYSGVYNLIGATYHFQGQYHEAYLAHERAYIAALTGNDTLSMAQSRSWQANSFREQARYHEATQTIEAALRLVSSQNNGENVRMQAHLFASGAEIAALTGADELSQRYLDTSQVLLSRLPYEYYPEFDHASWHQFKGTCALILKQNDIAAKELQQAIDSLPDQSNIRLVITLMPLAIAYARKRNRDYCFEIAKKAAGVVKAINAPALNRQFAQYVQQEILSTFPDDQEIKLFATVVQQLYC